MNHFTKKQLVLTSHLFIIRFYKGNLDPSRLAWEIVYSLPNSEELNLAVRDTYPEANVAVFEVLNSRPSTIRKQILIDIKALNDPRIDFVGRVRMRTDTEVYQIYTGNIFLSLAEDKLEKIDFICQNYDLRLKTERVENLQFSAGAFYAEAINGAHHVFDIVTRMLRDQPDLVLIAEPELVVKRKTFEPRKEQTFNIEGIAQKTDSTTNSVPVALGITTFNSNYDTWINTRTRLKEAQAITKGAGTIIGIIDDGIESDHPAFQTQKHHAISRDFLGVKSDPAHHRYFDEKHGTACASIALSSDKLAPGVSPETRLLVVRTKGLGSVLEAKAISWAANKGADVLSCSWGTYFLQMNASSNFNKLDKRMASRF